MECDAAEPSHRGLAGPSEGKHVDRASGADERLRFAPNARVLLVVRVDEHGNTRDGRIHLGHEECLGACAYAPMMRVDERYCEDLDLEQARRIVDALE
jgi:hypothetical protein